MGHLNHMPNVILIPGLEVITYYFDTLTGYIVNYLIPKFSIGGLKNEKEEGEKRDEWPLLSKFLNGCCIQKNGER